MVSTLCPVVLMPKLVVSPSFCSMCLKSSVGKARGAVRVWLSCCEMNFVTWECSVFKELNLLSFYAIKSRNSSLNSFENVKNCLKAHTET